MQPEDIDKLFRDRLAEHAPTPPAYLWNQLEEELQPEKKRPVLWLWAAAASVALLLVSGVLWLQLGSSVPSGKGALATASQQKTAQPAAAAQPEKKSDATTETQATPLQALASTTSKDAAEAPAPSPSQPQDAHLPARQLAAASVSESRSKRAAASQSLNNAPAPEALAAATPKTQPERISEPVEAPSAPRQLPATALAAASPAAPTGPIEVEVRRSDAETAVATAAQQAESGTRPRLGQLLRLGRSAVRGDRVTLADAGLPETVTVQARVAGRTLTKVIQL
ncbi:hypothetical protein [Hymenobacter psychrotolerans]|uniref:Uncharacterized protein n=1 Tax=Hymenobacter psychrotolerans DSM 18569 TaxID=1121959 RepID=A0A1M7GI56_9BACT|nr:hypothetical protein [Hymenobacter psychrotolerans]SHM15617.1 hypothetical protein SAMN02746009_04042 [Hymenobacter psychrotolerans DSM 18569]